MKHSLTVMRKFFSDEAAKADNAQMKAIGMPFHTPVDPTQLCLKLDDHYGKGYVDPLYRYDDDHPDLYSSPENS